ncbi:MAG: hypothetical protein ACXWQO_02940 [Bdellovibrionota bacterium]
MSKLIFLQSLLLAIVYLAPATSFAYEPGPFACNPEWGSGDAHICYLEEYQHKKTMPKQEADKILQKCLADIPPPPCEPNPPTRTCDPAKDEECEDAAPLQS